MNPLLVFYILTFFIIDISLNSCMLTKIYLYFLVGYWVLYLFIGKSIFHDTLRKWYFASYSQSYNPSIFSSVKLNLENAKKFIEEHSDKIGKKISLTLFFSKVLGECLELLPEANIAIRYGKAVTRNVVDIGVLVDMGGKDLSFATLRDIPKKSIETLYDEMYSKANSLKKGEDQEQKKQSKTTALFPSFILGPMLEVAGFLSNIGIKNKELGVNKNMFGSFLVSSVGTFKVDNAYAPLCPFTHTEGVLTLCAVKKSTKLQKDGSNIEHEYLPVNICLDHRYFDGAVGSKLIAKVQEIFDNPKSMRVY